MGCGTSKEPASMSSASKILSSGKRAYEIPLGVSVQFLKKFVEKYQIGAMTTAQVVEKYVKPTTKDTQQSYLELMIKYKEVEDGDFGLVTCFASHAWESTFTDLLNALVTLVQDEHWSLNNSYFYLDLFIVDQNHSPLKSGVAPAEIVGPAMRQAGKTALLLMPYDNPPAFKQAWCIVDLATAAQTSRLTNDAVYSQGSAKFFMMLPKSEQPWFRETFNDRFDKLLATVNSIDLRTATTPDPDDKSIILELCGDMDLLHSSVLFMLRTWLMEQGNAYILQMEAQKGPDHPKVALMLNNMSMLLNDMGREEEASKYANRALDIIETLGP